MLILRNISYLHPNKDQLFDELSLTVNDGDKIALAGNNGSGKSTLLKLIAGELTPAGGGLKANVPPYLLPQLFGQYDHLTIGQALRIDNKLRALKDILEGAVTAHNLDQLGDDWGIEERCSEAFRYWQLEGLDLVQKMGTLSGGQKTKVFLAGISIHQPRFLLLDEPSNHLDIPGRELLYNFIRSFSGTLIVVSHDRKLLNLLDVVYELDERGITMYGGNYDFYAAQKTAERNALSQDIKNREKDLRKAREKERETVERQQKLDARGKRKQEKAGVATIMMNTLRNNAEKSTARIKNTHAEKIGGISEELQALRSSLPDLAKMKFGFSHSSLHKGKVLFDAAGINFSYGDPSYENFQPENFRSENFNYDDFKSENFNYDDFRSDHSDLGHFSNSEPLVWPEDITVQIRSGERIALKGANGSGKTTLIKMIQGQLAPCTGTIYRADNVSVYIDQDYSLIDGALNVYEQACRFNGAGLQEHEVKIWLSRFLFTKEDWNKPCKALSGGEKMRLMLCCLVINEQSPDMIILDEPTNNLDIQNLEILTAALNEYRGTLIIVSHDTYFLEQINIERSIDLGT